MLDLKLSDFIGADGLWGRVQALHPFPFFDKYSSADLDKHLILNHGDKTVFYKIISLGLDWCASDIIFTYKQKWLDLISIESLTLDIGADKTHKISETLTHAETRNNTQDTVNKVSAFNTSELITNDGNNSTANDKIDYSKTRVFTDENLSYLDAFNNLSLKQQNTIIETVNYDVAKILTLDIY